MVLASQKIKSPWLFGLSSPIQIRTLSSLYLNPAPWMLDMRLGSGLMPKTEAFVCMKNMGEKRDGMKKDGVR